MAKNQKKRKNIWNIYQKELDLPKLEIEEEIPSNIQHSYFTYLIKVKNARNELATYLKNNDVYTTLRFQPLHKLNLYSKYAKKALPNSEFLNETGLNLPLHPKLTDNDMDKIISLIKKWTI